MEKMDEQMEIQDESFDEVGSLIFSPPPMIKSDTKDSISSIDSDISISFDRRCSKDEEADLSDSASGTDETDRILNTKKIKKITINSTKKLSNNTTDNNNDKINNELKNLIINNEIKNSAINNETNNIKNEDEEEDEEEIIISDELAEKITSQVEFYFSDDNIIKDAFLLKHVKRNKEGYVSLKLISSFKRVKHLSRDWRVVGKALRLKSKKLQVNELGTKLRRLNPLPQYDQTLPSRTIIVSKLPIDKLTIENVAEIFRKCGEIALIRILRPGHPVPAEVRQAIAKKSELGNDDECALIEFTDSSSARNAQKLIIGNAKIYELQQFSSNDKKRKQQLNQQKEQQNGKKNLTLRMSTAREKSYINSSSCPSGSEDDIRNFRISKNPRIQNRNIFAPVTSPYQGPPSPDVWLPRRFSACSIGSADNPNNLLLRRLSGCSNSGSNSDTGSYPGTRRFSSCSSSSENGYSSPLFHHHQQQQSHQNPLYPSFNYWTNQTPRRFSCCTTTGTTGLSNNIPAGYGFDYNSPFYQTGRRASADCGPFLRRLSNCSRDSGYDGTRRASSCSSSSDSCSGFRSRSNSGFVLMAHLPENVTRMPSGPDGTRGFGRNNNHSTNHSQTIVPSC
ncbi:hypothetical protein HCN44_006638 [Aphidius gifuensis]|uniref:La-related protein 6 n=1 Tax=Aphidius gifuensis TaxID=684658 RepID=A0A834XZ45_APHGI|nr:la-related protein 6 [Aphidius gifuensis]KAF7995531.1 hypothetical protein HCN44_006638 [Aphidius gifuensis]